MSWVIFRHARKVNGDFFVQAYSEVVMKRVLLSVGRCEWPSSRLISRTVRRESFTRQGMS